MHEPLFEGISLFESDAAFCLKLIWLWWHNLLPVSEIQGCGFNSKEEIGVIKSQNWPMNYKANTECMWNIALPIGKKITLEFTDFDLEAKDIQTSKCYDNIMVYEISRLTNALSQKYGRLLCLSDPFFNYFKARRLVLLCIQSTLCHHFRSVLWDSTASYHQDKKQQVGDSFPHRLGYRGQRIQGLLDNGLHSACSHWASCSTKPLGQHHHRWGVYWVWHSFKCLHCTVIVFLAQEWVRW